MSTVIARRPGRRSGFTLVEILVIIVMVAILFSVSFQSFIGARDRSSNAKVDGNVRQIQQALIIYEADNEKLPRYLTPEAGSTALLDGSRSVVYLPGNVLPRAAWTDNWQGNNLNKIAADMPASTDAGAGYFRFDAMNDGDVKVRLPAQPTKLAGGRLPAKSVGAPAAANFTFRNYGAVMYEANPSRNLFILHGVGKHQGDARVVALATNAR